jgi:hypothetical protein
MAYRPDEHGASLKLIGANTFLPDEHARRSAHG